MQGRLTMRAGKATAALTLALAAGPPWSSPAAARADLPDLVIAHAKVTMKCDARGTRTANIFAIVKNQSPKATADLSANPWHIVIQAEYWYTTGGGVGPYVKPQKGGPASLKPGGAWPTDLVITGIQPAKNQQKPGVEEYGFKVVADPANIVAEANEKNNEKLLSFSLKNCQEWTP